MSEEAQLKEEAQVKQEQPIVGSYGLAKIWQEKEKLMRVSRAGLASHLMQQAWNGLVTSPITSLLTVFTISVTLFLLSAFVLVVENVSGALESSRTGVGLTVYMKDGASQDQIDSLSAEIRGMPEVSEVEFVSAERALADFRKSLGDRALIAEGLDQQNPLPVSLEVKFKSESTAPEFYDQMVANYSAKPGVEEIYFSKGLIGKISELMRLIRVGGGIATLLLLLVTSFIIANTIRLALHAHRHEIEIMRLVGATDWHIRIPYLLEGCLHGIVGGVIALSLLYATFSVFLGLTVDIELFRMLLPQIHFLAWPTALLVVLSGMGVGILGSFVALQRIMHEQ
jgi:cell division transport system permease protein